MNEVNRSYILVIATKVPGVIRYEGIQDIKLKFVIPAELLTCRAVNMLIRDHPLSAEQVSVDHAFRVFCGGFKAGIPGIPGKSGNSEMVITLI